MKKNNLPLALYIHIPFCESICDYCDFTKLQYFHSFAEKYLVALKKELLEKVTNKDLKTIYIGGGTPTSLSDSQFEELLKMVEPFSKNVEEYVVESNPESLSLSKIKLLKKYKVNRVSIGVESTDDKVLKSINRKHTFNDVKEAVMNLRKNDINNINLDLIIGLPHVSSNMLIKDIYNILSLKPNHISCYSLTVHEHTKFFINKINEPSESFAYEAYKGINKILKDNGFIHYEVSNWALPNYESKHNLVYWRNEEYYGVGLGASGYINHIRYKNTTNFQKYISLNNEIEEEYVSKKDETQYEIMLRLRILEGIELSNFKNKFGYDLYQKNKSIIDDFVARGYLIINDNKLSATFDGMMILDKIVLDLI